jgi:hypothetical protein
VRDDPRLIGRVEFPIQESEEFPVGGTAGHLCRSWARSVVGGRQNRVKLEA